VFASRLVGLGASAGFLATTAARAEPPPVLPEDFYFI
jgi:hypothetical protein